MEQETKTVFVFVALKVKTNANVSDVVHEMDYDFKHDEIVDMEITGIETEQDGA